MTAPTQALVGKAEGAVYDLGFCDANDVFIGLTLNEVGNKPRYQEFNDPALASQFFTGQADYANLQPQKEMQIGQDSWEEGMGQEYFETGTKKYYYTKNADGRHKGMFIAGPVATEVTTLPVLMTITDGGLNTWTTATNLTNWTETLNVNGTVTREATVKEEGAFSAALYGGNGAGGYAQIVQDAVTWLDAFRGTTFVVTCRAYKAGAAGQTPTLEVYDGTGSATTATTATDTAWETLTVKHKCSATATKLEIKCKTAYASGAGACYFDNVVLRGTYGAHGSHWAEFDDDLFFTSNDCLLRVDATAGTISLQATLPQTITGLCAHVDGNLYIFQSSTATYYYYYMSTAEVLTASDSVKDFAVVVGANMKSVDLPYTVHSAADPTADANWDSPGTTIGKSTDNITAILEVEGLPYVMKEDFPYYIDSSGNEQKLGENLLAERASTSGVNTVKWGNAIYVPCGAQALWEFDFSADTWTDVSPSKYITNSSVFDGRVQALTSDAQYLYAIIDNGSYVELIAGRWEVIDSTATWVWHSLAQLEIEGAATAFASTVYKRRIWIGSTLSTDSLYYFPYTSMYGNITADTDYTYQTDGDIVTPYHHLQLKADAKAWVKLTVSLGHTYSATVYFEGWYQMLGGNWTDIGDFDGTSGNRTETIYLPVETTTSSKPSSTMMRFKFVPKTNAAATTPVLLNYDVRAIWYPPHKKLAYAQVKVSDNMLLRNGQTDENQNAATIRTALDAWDNPTTAWLRAFYPPYWKSSTDTVYAKLMPTTGVPFCETVRNEENNEIEWVYNLTIMVTDVTF